MSKKSSKDLLELESNAASGYPAESKLLLFKESNASSPTVPEDKPTMFPVPKSRVLGQVKDFLGVISEANKKLQENAKENPDNYDIEVVDPSESNYIEMDLMLGITDLHTPEAVAAAEAAVAGGSLCGTFNKHTSDSNSEDESSDDEDDDSQTETMVKESDCKSGSKSIRESSAEVKDGEKQRERKRKRCPRIVELT